jgi:hypothetical protein
MDKPLAFPKVKLGPDPWHIQGVGGFYRVVVML